MDIRKYQPVKRTTPVEIKSVEREQDVLIEEFSKRQDLIWILLELTLSKTQLYKQFRLGQVLTI